MLFSAAQTMSHDGLIQQHAPMSDRPAAAAAASSLKRVLSERRPADHSAAKNTIHDRDGSMIRTLNDLQRNILFYGIEKVSLYISFFLKLD